jgi:hypothetical protein
VRRGDRVECVLTVIQTVMFVMHGWLHLMLA